MKCDFFYEHEENSDFNPNVFQMRVPQNFRQCIFSIQVFLFIKIVMYIVEKWKTNNSIKRKQSSVFIVKVIVFFSDAFSVFYMDDFS